MWRIELFGEPRLVGYGQVINRFESKRAVALLAYLALHPNTRHPREVLADRIWPDAPLESARNRLKQALASLRRILEPPNVTPGSVLDADRAAIGLRPGAFVCDVDELRSLVDSGEYSAAAKIKKGELLPGFFDDWLEDIRLGLSAYEYELECSSPNPAKVGQYPHPQKRTHIPAAVSSFIGREQECQDIVDALTRSRWVTVTGLGGIGKTRTTQEVGRNWTSGDAFFVPLAGLNEVRQVPYSILAALGSEPPPGDPFDEIQSLLSAKPTLLILDNAESVPSEGLGALAIRMLESCSELRLLVSSRIPIRFPAEAVISLTPFGVPAVGTDPKALLLNDSVKLFVDRARNSRPDFQVTEANAATIVAICGKLEGSPLAIELCAAWSRLGTSTLLAKLEQGQSLLSARKSAGVGRHESTHRVFESTCDLLSAEARTFLGQLSLFRTGFELPLLDDYCSPAPTPEALTELIEASLVVPVYESDPERFYLLESVRQHAESALSESDFVTHQRRFVAMFARLATEARDSVPNRSLGLRDQSDWIRFLLRNWDCFQLAAQIASGSGTELAEAIVFGTEWFWSLYIADREVLRTIKGSDRLYSRLLELTYLRANEPEDLLLKEYDNLLAIASAENDDQLVAPIQLRKAKLKVLRQHMDGVEQLALSAASLFRESGDSLNLGQALHLLYNASIQGANSEACDTYRAEADRCFRECGNLVNLAALVYTRCREHYMRKEYEQALSALYRCRDIAASLGNMRFMGRTANLFGVVLRHLGDEARARVYFYLSLVASLRIRDSRGSHIPMWNLFLSLGKDGEFEQGAVVMGYAMHTYNEYFGADLEASDAELLEGFLQQARADLGNAKVVALEAEGRRLSLDDLELRLQSFLANELQDHQPEIKAFLNQDR